MIVLSAWLALALILCTSASIAIWSRRATASRTWAIAVLLASLPASLPIAASGLSRPIPYLPGITVSRSKHTVLGFKVVRGKAIYVLFDGHEPRYYRLPFSAETAQALEDAKRKAGKRGKVQMKDKGGNGLSQRGQFNVWAQPQPPLPPKQPQAPAVDVN